MAGCGHLVSLATRMADLLAGCTIYCNRGRVRNRGRPLAGCLWRTKDNSRLPSRWFEYCGGYKSRGTKCNRWSISQNRCPVNVVPCGMKSSGAHRLSALGDLGLGNFRMFRFLTTLYASCVSGAVAGGSRRASISGRDCSP